MGSVPQSWASWRSASISSSGDMRKRKGRSSYRVQNLQAWWVQPAVAWSSRESAS